MSTLGIVTRVCFSFLSAGLLFGGGLFLIAGLQKRSECREADAAEVLGMSIDVGAAGEQRGTIKQIASFPCRQYIRIEPELRAGEDAPTVLRGLELTVAIKDAGDHEHAAGAFPALYPGREDATGAIVIDFTPMPEGDYSVIVDVVKPVPALAGRPVRVVSGYILCGLEWWGPMMGIGIGTAGLVIGAGICVLMLATWPRRSRHSHRGPGRQPAGPERMSSAGYRITLACAGVPADAGEAAARDIEREFAEFRTHFQNVTCTFADGQLVLGAESDVDGDGRALVDEFSDCIAAYTPPFDSHIRVVSITTI